MLKIKEEVKRLTVEVKDYKPQTINHINVPIFEETTGRSLSIPLILVRGKYDGSTLGLTAAVHGNELNGIKIIHEVLEEISLENLSGNLLCAPIVNIPSFRTGDRVFIDGQDLNHVFPGSKNGPPSHQYARAFINLFLPSITHLVDIHTVSEGRTNTLYVRANFENKKAWEMANSVDPDIILHTKSGDGTLRHAAAKREIPAITLEAGNPNVIQGRMVFDGTRGLINLMKKIGMLQGEVSEIRKPIICESSKWIRTNSGGLLDAGFKLKDRVLKKQCLAITYDPYGNELQKYHAPYEGIVIGMAAYPVAIPGTRFCHLGKIKEKT